MMRINKYIAQSGLCSRRKAEKLIEEGLVQVNGKKVIELSTVVDERKRKKSPALFVCLKHI